MRRKKSEPKKISRRTVLKRLIFGGIALGLVDAVAIEPKWLQFNRVDIPLANLPPSFDGYRIALLSDFHVGNFISTEYIRKAFAMAGEFKPDVFILPGDFVHSHDFVKKSDGEVPDLAPAFVNLDAPDGAFAVLGNHDNWVNPQEIAVRLDRVGIRVLLNKSAVVRRGSSAMAFVGTDDLRTGFPNLEKALKGAPKTAFRILLQHNPDFAEEMHDGHHVDLQLSGHTHGGQIKIPFGPAIVMRSRYGNKYREGLVQGPKHPVYVTRGIGVATPFPIRFFCRPEVTAITLRRA